MTETKVCIICGINRPITDFRENRNQCYLCRNKMNRERYKINPQKTLDSNRNYRLAHTEKCRGYARAWVLNNPEKRKEIANRWAKKWYANNTEEAKRIAREYTAAHPDRRRASVHKYTIANMDKINERQRKYYLANPDKLKEKQRKYRTTHYYKIKAEKQNRVARERKALGDGITPEQMQQLYDEYNYSCVYCGKREPEIKLTLDHIIPLNRNGLHDISNIVPACKSCNSSKQDKPLLLWLYSRLINEKGLQA